MPDPITSRLTLKPLRPDRYGHPWIFAGEVASGPEPPVEDGDWIRIIDHNGKPAGAGYYNQRSKIVARRVGHVTETASGEFVIPDKAWWTQQLRAAYAYRMARGIAQRGFYRLVHSEADGLPGLIVDVYGNFAVVQLLTLGVDRQKELIVKALSSAVPSLIGIYERSDTTVRKLEGLDEHTGVLSGETPPERLELADGDARILVDITHGGKTGLFLDQIENQKSAANEARGRDVLNCFSYTGLFGLRAALAGAKSVEDVESSSYFQAIAQDQWTLNKHLFAKCTYRQTIGNAFDDLRNREESGYKADMVILDPPAFTKSKSGYDSALRGYNEINRRGLKLLRPGGILVTCSCSHHISYDDLAAIVQKSARDARRNVRLVERRGQPADHPILFNVPETEYLKVLTIAVE